MAFPAYTKDPQARLDYRNDWTAWLAEDATITASTFTAETGLTVGATYFDDTSTTVWLSGGTDGTTYQVVNHVVDSEGREDDRTFLVKVKQR